MTKIQSGKSDTPQIVWMLPVTPNNLQAVLARKTWYEDTGTVPPGQNGTDGANCHKIKEMNSSLQNPLPSLRKYMSAAREHLAKHIQVSDLSGFLKYLSTAADIKALYSTIDLIEEFEAINNHDFKMRNKLAFIPHYELLRDRIATHAQSADISTEEEKALNYLYTAVMSRLFAMKSQSNHIAVVNLFEYMKIVEKRMTKLQHIKRTVYINEYRDEFKSSLDTKIQTAIKLIQRTVGARISGKFTAVGAKIEQLLDETFAMENSVLFQTEKAKENKKKLKTQMIAHSILNPLNEVGSMLSGLGPVGMIAGKVIGFGKNVAEKVIGSTLKLHIITVPTGLVKANVIRVAEQAKQDFKLLQMQLDDMKSILQNENLSNFTELMQAVNLTTIQMNNVTANSEIPEIDQFELLMEARKNLTSLISESKKNLTKYGDEMSDQVKFANESLNDIDKLLKVGDVGLQIYKQIRADKKKIAAIDATIRELDDQLLVIKQHERNIHNVMIPQFKMVEQSVNEAILNSAGKSHCELIVANWTVQGSLDKVKKLFNVMTQDFSMGADLDDCFDKINEGITTIVDVYDRIDSYTEKAQLADLMADIAIGANDIKDSNLRNAIFKMENTINTNLVMEQYEMAMYALKQHKFPFAEQYLDQFDLLSNFSTTNTEFTNHAIDRIGELVLKIRESKSLIERVDEYLYSNYSFTKHEAFFKWDHFDHNDEIADLLNGDDTIFVAGIENGLDLNAIKFNEIWLKFKLKNQTIQGQFDAELRKFSVNMQMVGNNFYRCGKRVYYISLETPLLISFSLEHGEVTKMNRVYDKLATGDPFLSPYSTWRITLRSKADDEVDYRRLKQFTNEIEEIALEGRGQFFKNKGDIISETCNEHLDKFYRLDSVSSQTLFY